MLHSNPLQKSPERAFALQKYLLLHSQQDSLHQNLKNLTESHELPSEPNAYRRHSRSGSSASSSQSLSPSFGAHRHSSLSSSTSISPISEVSDDFSMERPVRPSLGRPRRSSLPATMSTFDASLMNEVETEEQKLLNVNQQIKTTLTELLNCEGTRNDERYRVWVMERLMDVERDLKIGRRRDSVVSRMSDERRRSSAASRLSNGA